MAKKGVAGFCRCGARSAEKRAACASCLRKAAERSRLFAAKQRQSGESVARLAERRFREQEARAARVAARLCTACGERNDRCSAKTCQPCADKRALFHAARKGSHVASGLCNYGGCQAQPLHGLLVCARHREERRGRSAAAYTLRKVRALCRRGCGDAAAPGKSRCARCISKYKNWATETKAMGLCSGCRSRVAADDAACCEQCIGKHVDRYRARVRDSMCVSCGEVARDGKVFCEECAHKNHERWLRHKELCDGMGVCREINCGCHCAPDRYCPEHLPKAKKWAGVWRARSAVGAQGEVSA